MLVFSQRIRFWAALLLITLFSGATAWWRVFSVVALPDDDGSIMLSVQRFFDGGILFDQLPSIYGPLYYVYEWLPHLLSGAPVSHDSIRVPAVIFWVAAGLALFLLVYRTTGSLALAMAAHFCGFRALSFISAEPSHPQELCVLLVLAVLLAACASRFTTMIWFGVLLAALALTKINLAMLVGVAFAVVYSLALPRGTIRRILAPAAITGALALPFVLMSPNLTQAWALRFALLISLSLAPAILAAAGRRIEPISLRDLALAGVACLICAALIAWFVLARGSTVGGIIRSTILWPRDHFRQAVKFPLNIPIPAVIWAAAALPLAWLAARKRLPPVLVAALKLAMGAMVVAGIASRRYAGLIGGAAPMLWLAAMPVEGFAQEAAGDLLRPLLAVLGVLQVLYAYPVAGSQAAFATVAIVAAAAISVWDALRWMGPLIPAAVRRAAPAAAIALVVAASGTAAARTFAIYRSCEPLGLPGAQRVRVDRSQAMVLRRLQAAAQPCSMLVTAPGLISLNFFSGKPVPAGIPGAVAGPWMLLLDDREQAGIVRELAAQPHPCAVYNPEIARMWTPGEEPPIGPVMRYILANFSTQFEAEGYRFMVRKAD